MHNFFGFINDDYAFLEPEEINHAIKSLRLGIGEKVKVFDGLGKIFIGEIDLISKKEVRAVKIEIIENHGRVNGYLHIAISPTKNIDRWNFFLEKATEIGVHEITPIISSHSERKFINQKRSKKILKSACLQSEKSILPKFNELTFFKNLIKNDYDYYKYIASCTSIDKLSLNDLIRYPDRTQSIVLIGNICPGFWKLCGVEFLSTRAFIVFALSEALIPVVTPLPARSTLTVKAVW